VNLLEIHSRKADNGVAVRYGFGCGEYSPGRDWRLGRGFVLHGYIIRNPLTHVNNKRLALRNRVTYNRDMARKRLPAEVLEFFKKQGAKGGKMGGAIRAARMTAEERSESARKAVQARWAKGKGVRSE
jgi:hypothetical protein